MTVKGEKNSTLDMGKFREEVAGSRKVNKTAVHITEGI